VNGPNGSSSGFTQAAGEQEFYLGMDIFDARFNNKPALHDRIVNTCQLPVQVMAFFRRQQTDTFKHQHMRY